jgi:hypothetical protein
LCSSVLEQVSTAGATLEKIHSSLPVGEGARGLFGAAVETKWTEAGCVFSFWFCFVLIGGVFFFVCSGYVPEIKAAQQVAKPQTNTPAPSQEPKKEKRNSAREKEAEVMSEKVCRFVL